jgi:ketosteroid isomerase-like protein
MATGLQTKPNDEAEIRGLMDIWAQALHAKDVDGIMRVYAADVRAFDLAPPLQHVGAATHRRNFQEWFRTFRGPIGSDLRDFNVTSSGDVALCHGFNRISGTKTSGEETSVWVRVTLGLRRENGAWKVMHEHVSVPFYMDGSVKAAVDLAP